MVNLTKTRYRSK